MSVLRSALDELGAEDLSFASDQALHQDLDELERASRRLEAERVRRIAEVERRGSFADDGCLSMTSWLMRRLGIAASIASQQVRLGRALQRMPRTRASLADGDISVAAAALLATAREADPGQFERSEGTLLDAAGTLSVRDLKVVLDHWRRLADASGAGAQEERRFGRRGLYVSPTLDGMVRVDGDLDAETGQTVVTALRPVQDSWSRSTVLDARTPAQRRADALGEICRRYLDSPDRPAVAGERPHVTVTLDLESLEGRAGRRCELDDVGRIAPEAARRLACDASVSRVITRGASEPLDAGRRTPVIPAALRRAVVVRDGGCRFPGCDRPQTWCDGHHVVHWADGGRTSVDNLLLLCRPHHRLVHARFGLRMIEGRPMFVRPDGSVLEGRPPP